MRSSPRSRIRRGQPSASSSEETKAGSQYWRIRFPMGVPGPTRQRTSLSFFESIFDSSPAFSAAPASLLPKGTTGLWANHSLQRPVIKAGNIRRCFGQTRVTALLANIIRLFLRLAGRGALMVESHHYWTKRVGTSISRRKWVATTGALGAGALALGLSGCGSSSKSSNSSSGGASMLYNPVDTTAKATRGGTYAIFQQADIGAFNSGNGGDAANAMNAYS